jgi:hypothetical protein
MRYKYTITIDGTGNHVWYKRGTMMVHRERGPAIVSKVGSKFWYLNGVSHRLNGPAIEWSNGSNEWYQNGMRHRSDGPAVESWNGHKIWYLNGIEVVKAWLLENPDQVISLKAWPLLSPDDIVSIRLNK